jgi:hypothetical protein
MTASQETRFTCDVCNEARIEALANTPAPARGLKPPEGWTVLWVNDFQTAAQHLCPKCSRTFVHFMEGKP